MIDCDTIVLDRARFGVQGTISDHVLTQAVNADVIRDEFMGGLTYRLTTEIFRHKISGETIRKKQTVTHEFVDGPWQRFKQRHLTNWWFSWLPLVPVRTHTQSELVELVVGVDDYALFPSFGYHVPDKFGPVVFRREVSSDH